MYKEAIIHIEVEITIIPRNILQAHVPLFYKHLSVVVTTQSIETGSNSVVQKLFYKEGRSKKI
jgi:hypothetical protein